MAQHAFCALMALTVHLLTTVSEAQRIANKAASAYCQYEPVEKSLTMVFLADYNGDPVDKVLAISGRVYDRTNNNEAPCTITTRSSPDKIMITSKLYTDNSQNHVNPCGARQTDPANAMEFEWTVEIREAFTQKVYTDIDRRYLIKCKIQDADSNYITTSINVYGEDIIEDATRVRPDNEMSILEYLDGIYMKRQGGSSGIKIGQNVKLRITSKLHPQYQAFLHYYGSCPFSCDRSASASFNPSAGVLQFIGSNSCPTQEDPFGLNDGFTKADVNVTQAGFYNLETEAFVFAPDIPESKQYHLRCYLKYCYGNYDPVNPTNNDQKCEKPCGSNEARKRRSTSVNDYDQVILTVNIDTAETAGRNEESVITPEKSTQTTLIAITTVIGILILGFIIAIVILLLFARNRMYKADSTTSEYSTTDQPIHQVLKA